MGFRTNKFITEEDSPAKSTADENMFAHKKAQRYNSVYKDKSTSRERAGSSCKQRMC